MLYLSNYQYVIYHWRFRFQLCFAWRKLLCVFSFQFIFEESNVLWQAECSGQPFCKWKALAVATTWQESHTYHWSMSPKSLGISEFTASLAWDIRLSQRLAIGLATLKLVHTSLQKFLMNQRVSWYVFKHKIYHFGSFTKKTTTFAFWPFRMQWQPIHYSGVYVRGEGNL